MKIVQIAVTAGGEDNACDTMYALTDTGEVDVLPKAASWRAPGSWHILPPLPEKKEEVPQ